MTLAAHRWTAFALVLAASAAAHAAEDHLNLPYQGVMGVVIDPLFRVNSEIVVFPASANVRCEELKASDKAKGVRLPPMAKLRLSPDAQLSDPNAWRVFIYSVPSDAKVSEEVVKERYFKEPMILCRTGEVRVQDDLLRRSGGFNTGILVVPFKLRGGDIFGDSTIGPYVSYHVDRVELLLTAGLAQISTVERGAEDLKNETGLTIAAGLKFQIKKDWDIALVVGADRLSGEAGRNWKYQNRTWVSFAVGFSFTR